MPAFSNEQCEAIAEIIREEMSEIRAKRGSLDSEEMGKAVMLAILTNRFIKLFLHESPDFNLRRFKDIVTCDNPEALRRGLSSEHPLTPSS